MTEPVLEARSLGVAFDGAQALTDVDVVTRGARVLLVGDVLPWVRVLSGTSDATGGQAAVTDGQLRVVGRPLGQHHGHFGAAPNDLPFPRKTKLRAYLRTVAGLARDEGRRSAAALADDTIERLGLTQLAGQRLDRLDRASRRAALVAVAAVQGAEGILLHEPLTGLESASAAGVWAVVGRAVEGRAAVVAVSDLRLEGASSRLLPQASDVLVFRDGRLLVHTDGSGLLGASRVYSLTVLDDGTELADALAAEGAKVQGGPLHYALSLPEGRDVADVLRLATSTGAAVITCEPLLGAAPAES